jgi:hypothetical protein
MQTKTSDLQGRASHRDELRDWKPRKDSQFLHDRPWHMAGFNRIGTDGSLVSRQTAKRGGGYIQHFASPIGESVMRILYDRKSLEGRVGWVLLWLLGVPIPVLLILFLLRGCT